MSSAQEWKRRHNVQRSSEARGAFHGTMTIAFLISLLGSAAALSATVDTETFFADFASKRDKIRVLQATFKQETVTPDETLNSEGTLFYARPKRLIFRYSDPVLAYVIDGLRAYEYDDELKQLQIFDLDDRPETEAFFLGFDNDAGRLEEAYVVEVEQGKGENWLVTLTPRNKKEKFFERVRLTLRPEDLLPTEIHIVNDQESEVWIRVMNYEINGAVEAGGAQVLVPEGTLVVENDRYVETIGPGGRRFPPTDVPVKASTKGGASEGTVP